MDKLVMTVRFECDQARLESRIKHSTKAAYLMLLSCGLIYYFEPAWLAAIHPWFGPLIFGSLFLALSTIEKQSRGDLDCHRGEVISINKNRLKFHQASSGYTFEKSLDDIESATLSQWFGVPRIKVRFSDNQFYQFKWFKDSSELYQLLKRQDEWLKKG
ncbi:hypothetical protein [Vibrio scophthalmi]|uniref:hypothetical protein n=1 Tax=Vibrio scophthalmi TaxID=45658 RepID=UPI001E3F1528|nr:hypothetical protein [Vibrio scophthalmi]